MTRFHYYYYFIMFNIFKFFISNSKVARQWTVINKNYLVPAPPAPPATAYLRFVQARFAANHSIPNAPKIQLVELAKQWKSIGPQEKKIYEEQYRVDNEIYRKLYEQYTLKYVQPFKIPKSGYEIFLKEQLSGTTFQRSNKTIQQRFSDVSKSWQKLSVQQKKKYQTAKDVGIENSPKNLASYALPILKYKNEKEIYNQQTKGNRNRPIWIKLTQQQRLPYKQKYESYLVEYNRQLDAFLTQRGLTRAQFSKLLEKRAQKSAPKNESSKEGAKISVKKEKSPKKKAKSPSSETKV